MPRATNEKIIGIARRGILAYPPKRRGSLITPLGVCKERVLGRATFLGIQSR